MSIWHDIPEFPDYEISLSAIIRRKSLTFRGKRQLILSQTRDGKGYIGVKLKHESGSWRRVKIHVLMMKVFVGDRPKGLVINHIDGDKTNNLLSNLEYCTHRENEIHSLTALGKKHFRDSNGCFISHDSTKRVVRCPG